MSISIEISMCTCVCDTRIYECVCLSFRLFFFHTLRWNYFNRATFFPLWFCFVCCCYCCCCCCFSIVHNLHLTNSHFLPLLNTFKLPYSNHTYTLVYKYMVRVSAFDYLCQCLSALLPNIRSNIFFTISNTNSMQSLYTPFVWIHSVCSYDRQRKKNASNTFQMNIFDIFVSYFYGSFDERLFMLNGTSY